MQGHDVMARALALVVAGICAAIAWPVIGFKDERRETGWLPRPPDQAKLDAEKGSWFHRKKNLWVDSVRRDAEWWGKFLAFVILLLIIVGFVT